MKKKIYFLAAALFLFIFFTMLVPVHFIYNSEFMWGLIIGACVGTGIYYGLRPDPKKMYTPENYEDGKTQRTFAIVAAIIAGIITLPAVYFLNIPRENNYIRKHSIIAEGVVTNGQAETRKSRGSSTTTYQLDINFTVNGKTFSRSVSVDGSDWSDAGIGMPVLVSYAKDHPNMCKILFNAEHVRKYADTNLIRPFTLQEFIALHSKKEDGMLKYLQKISLGWMEDESEKETPFCYNSVFKSTVLSNDDLLYYVETGTGNNFNMLLDRARKEMTAEYDSMKTDPKQGAVFQQDSLRIRFQEYTEMTRTEQNSEYGLMPMIKSEDRYVIGITTSKGYILLPGDLVEDEGINMKLFREQGNKYLDKLRQEGKLK